eukprot:TRINITY_DN411_c0_g1_i6.p1 TRINITY_DN411_c0_g1~~TRINITY_DN411_c0_g1_i6.p1  ORF type:complete len:227 (+),score=66.11 TRINITY_DN411_c0_g1_i6:95-682(+)
MCIRDRQSTWDLDKKHINFRDWVSSASNRAALCADTRVFGLYGAKTKVTKKLENLPSHFAVRMVSDVYMIDKFDGNLDNKPLETLSVTMDNQVVSTWRPPWEMDQPRLCGQKDWPDRVWKNDLVIEHTGSTLDIAFEDFLEISPKDARWGLAVTTVEICQCHASCKTCSGGWKNCVDCADPNAKKGADGTCAQHV